MGIQQAMNEEIEVTATMWLAAFLQHDVEFDRDLLASIYATMERVRRAELDPKVKAANRYHVSGRSVIFPAGSKTRAP